MENMSTMPETGMAVRRLDTKSHPGEAAVRQKGGTVNGLLGEMLSPAESQIYNWGIKTDAALDGEGRGKPRISSGVSSTAPERGALRADVSKADLS